jgi:hypothetical protein
MKAQKILRFSELTAAASGSKRFAVQSHIGAGTFLLAFVGVDGGFGSTTKVLKILGKNPTFNVSKGTALRKNERLIEMPAGPGISAFHKFELLRGEELQVAERILGKRG